MKKKTTRVQIELPDASMERLRGLKERTEATSYADVIRNAFVVYERLADTVDSGKAIKIVDRQTGEEVELELFLPV